MAFMDKDTSGIEQKGSDNARNNSSAGGMSVIVKTVTRLTVRLIFLFGIYVILHGHLTPGGGFAGGVMLALAAVHLMLAYGGKTALEEISFGRSQISEGLGGLLFLLIGVAGLFAAGGFLFRNFLATGNIFNLASAGTIPLANIAIGLKVMGGLFAIFVAMVIVSREKE